VDGCCTTDSHLRSGGRNADVLWRGAQGACELPVAGYVYNDLSKHNLRSFPVRTVVSYLHSHYGELAEQDGLQRPSLFGPGSRLQGMLAEIGVGHGKRAARMIDNWLFNQQPARRVGHPLATLDMLNLWYFGDHERRMEPELSLEHRADFSEVVEGLTGDEAHFEAARCLSCGNCIECDGCLGACPEDAVIKLGKGYRYQYNYEKCTGCASCFDQCPVHAIEMIPEH